MQQQQQQQLDGEQQPTLEPSEQLAEVLCLTVQCTQGNALHDVRNFCRGVAAHPHLRRALLAAAVGTLHYTHSCSDHPSPAERQWLTKHKQLLRRFSVHMQPSQQPTVLESRYQVLSDLVRTTLQGAEDAQPGSWAISEFETPWANADVMAAVPAHSLTSLTFNITDPSILSEPVMAKLVALSNLQQLTVSLASSRNTYSRQSGQWLAAGHSLAPLTALTYLQTPYLAPEDQQGLPVTLKELHMINGAFSTAAPLQLGHLTAVTRMMFTSDGIDAVSRGAEYAGSYRLLKGSVLPPAVEHLDVQVVCSTEPLLQLSKLQALRIREAAGEDRELFCPAQELLELTKLSALTGFVPGTQALSRYYVAPEHQLPGVSLSVDAFRELAPVFVALPCKVKHLRLEQHASASNFSRKVLPSLAALTTLTHLALVGSAGLAYCLLDKFNQLPPGLDYDDLASAAQNQWGVVWHVTPCELASVLGKLLQLSALELRSLRLEKGEYEEGVSVGDAMLPVVQAAAGLPRLTSLCFSNVLLGPAVSALKPAARLRELELYDCFVGDSLLCDVLQDFGSSKGLTKLDLGRGVNDCGRLSASPPITNTAVTALGQLLPELQWLSLKNQDGVSVAALKQLVQRRGGCLQIKHAGYERVTTAQPAWMLGLGYYPYPEYAACTEEDWESFPDYY